MVNKFLFLSIIILSLFSAIVVQSEEITWFDGKNTHTIYKVPGIMAQFHKTTSPKIGTKAVEIVPINKISSKSKTIDEFSMVYSSKKNGPPDMALAPGIIIYFKKNISPVMVEQILLKYSLKLESYIELHNKNAWSVKTKAGVHNLKLVEELMQDSSIELATPNWWYRKNSK